MPQAQPNPASDSLSLAVNNAANNSVSNLLERVKNGKISVQQASAILAEQTLSSTQPHLIRNASAIPHSTLPWPIVRSTSDPNTNTSLLHVDCLTPENAKLVLALQEQLRFSYPASLLNDSSSNPQQVLEFTFTDCENFPSLVDRLGWPPPKPVIDAWFAQLAGWKETLLAQGWPLEYGNADDLMIDSQAQIIWPWLSIRIAQSMLSSRSHLNGNSTNGNLGPTPTRSLAGWNPLPGDENPLPAIQRISRLLVFQPSGAQFPNPSAALPDDLIAEHGVRKGEPKTLPKKDQSKQKPQSQRNQRKALETGLLAAAVVVVIGFGVWRLYPTRDPARSQGKIQASATTSASQPGSAGLFSSPQSTSPQKSGAASEQLQTEQLQTEQLQTLAPAPQNSNATAAASAPSSQTIAEDLGIAQFDASSFTGPTIDVQSEGFGPSTTELPISPKQAEIDPASEFPPPSNGTIATQFLQLPDRGDTAPLELPIHAGIQPQQLSLQHPSASTWNMLPSSAFDRLVIVPSGNESPDSAVAVLIWPDSEKASPTFQWGELAASNPAVESLRNARLSGSGLPVYLREPEIIEPLAVDFTTTSHRWPLKTLPDTKQTITTLRLLDRQKNDRPQDVKLEGKPVKQTPLIFQWLVPVDAQAGRKTRGLVEIRQTDEAPVRIRIRADLQIGRSVDVETIAIAALEPNGGWTALNNQTLPATLDRLGIVKENLSTTLNQVRQQYTSASSKDLKSLLRRKRDYLEQQETSTTLYGERLAELQILVGRIQTELDWHVTIATAWPDDQQTIFATKTP